MTRFLPFCLLLTLAASGLTGCAALAGKRKKPTRVAHAAQPLLVGVITLVNTESAFVLIDNGRSPAPQPGMALRSITGDTVSGELVATEVRKRPFIIADIRSGAPQKGDRVFLAEPGATTPAPATPSTPAAGAELLPQRSPGPAEDQ